MNIISYSREQIEEGLAQAHSRHKSISDHIRLLFVPTRINHDNFENACDIYSRIDSENYDTIVVVETYGKVLEKKLPMPSNKYFETPLGKVKVDDFLRNELCDEDDDFYICDEGFSQDMSLFQQLTMLQCICKKFSVLSIQIADGNPEIVKELASVLQEVLASRNVLIVSCCNLDNARKKEFTKAKDIIRNYNQSELMNYLNGGESKIEGAPSFIAGVLIANAWDLDLNFLDEEYEDYTGNLLAAFAEHQKVLS